MSAKSSTPVEVEIFGSVYPMRGHEDSEYLRELAAQVDRKMREVARQVTSADVTRIAILTALNLSDELFQCRRGQEGERVRIKEKVSELAVELETALKG